MCYFFFNKSVSIDFGEHLFISKCKIRSFSHELMSSSWNQNTIDSIHDNTTTVHIHLVIQIKVELYSLFTPFQMRLNWNVVQCKNINFRFGMVSSGVYITRSILRWCINTGALFRIKSNWFRNIRWSFKRVSMNANVCASQ